MRCSGLSGLYYAPITQVRSGRLVSRYRFLSLQRIKRHKHPNLFTLYWLLPKSKKQFAA
jgi:hypothetical protein